MRFLNGNSFPKIASSTEQSHRGANSEEEKECRYLPFLFYTENGGFKVLWCSITVNENNLFGFELKSFTEITKRIIWI